MIFSHAYVISGLNGILTTYLHAKFRTIYYSISQPLYSIWSPHASVRRQICQTAF